MMALEKGGRGNVAADAATYETSRKTLVAICAAGLSSSGPFAKAGNVPVKLTSSSWRGTIQIGI